MRSMNIGNGRPVLIEDDIYDKIKMYVGLDKEDLRIVYYKNSDIYNCLRENIYADKKTKMYNDRGPTGGRKYKGISVREEGKYFYLTLPFCMRKIYNSIKFYDIELAARQYDAVLDFVNRPGYRNFPEEKIDILPELKEHLEAWLNKHNIEVSK